MSAIISIHANHEDRKYGHRYRIVPCGTESYAEVHLDGDLAEVSFYMHSPENLREIAQGLLKAAQELEAAVPVRVPANAAPPSSVEEIPF